MRFDRFLWDELSSADRPLSMPSNFIPTNFRLLTRKIDERPVSGNEAHLKGHYKHYLGLKSHLKDIIIDWQTIILHSSSSTCPEPRYTVYTVRESYKWVIWAVPVPFHSWLDTSWKRKTMKSQVLWQEPIQMFPNWKVYFLVPIYKVEDIARTSVHSHPKNKKKMTAVRLEPVIIPCQREQGQWVVMQCKQHWKLQSSYRHRLSLQKTCNIFRTKIERKWMKNSSRGNNPKIYSFDNMNIDHEWRAIFLETGTVQHSKSCLAAEFRALRPVEKTKSWFVKSGRYWWKEI